MKRDTKLDNEHSTVHGTKRIWTGAAAVEGAKNIADADNKLRAAEEAAARAVATAVTAAEDAKEAKAEAARKQAEENKAAHEAKEREKKKAAAQSKAAKAVAAAVEEVVGGDPVVDADNAPAAQGDDKDKPAKKKAAKTE
jgi:hypothetical protein